MKFKDLTHTHITLIKSDIKSSEICQQFDISTATLVRWRRKLNIAPLKPGRKKGEERKKQEREIRTCHCGNTFEALPQSSKMSCSRECGYKVAKNKISKKAQQRWEKPTEAMIEGIELRRRIDKDEYSSYSRKVHNLTKKTYDKHKNEINPNNYPRTICGIEGGYQLDHIIPIKYGYENNIPPEVLAEKSNLRMLPWKENLMRNWNGKN